MQRAGTRLRFALSNVLMVAMIVAIAIGNPWIWIAFAMALMVGGLFDESLGDDESPVGPPWRHFYDFNLYLTLPLVATLACVLFRRAATTTLIDLSDPSALAVIKSLGLGLLKEWAGYPAAIIGAGYFFAVAGSTAAHELGHRVRSKPALLCARVLHAFSFNPSFEVYHGRFHHRNVGYYDDPSTARRQESLYAFLWRSIICQMTLAWNYECGWLRRKGSSIFSWRNRVINCGYVIVAIAIAAYAIGGFAGIVAFVVAASIARVLHEAINYVQHYGLVRVEGAPIEARHSWDTYHVVSNALHYNLPRHADHHRTAARPFWELEASDDAPQLPFGYENMTVIAFVPVLWRMLMDPRLAEWDARFASDAERALLRSAKGTITHRDRDALEGVAAPMFASAKSADESFPAIDRRSDVRPASSTDRNT